VQVSEDRIAIEGLASALVTLLNFHTQETRRSFRPNASANCVGIPIRHSARRGEDCPPCEARLAILKWAPAVEPAPCFHLKLTSMLVREAHGHSDLYRCLECDKQFTLREFP
jgi:hypothetical protein